MAATNSAGDVGGDALQARDVGDVDMSRTSGPTLIFNGETSIGTQINGNVINVGDTHQNTP